MPLMQHILTFTYGGLFLVLNEGDEKMGLKRALVKQRIQRMLNEK